MIEGEVRIEGVLVAWHSAQSSYGFMCDVCEKRNAAYNLICAQFSTWATGDPEHELAIGRTVCEPCGGVLRAEMLVHEGVVAAVRSRELDPTKRRRPTPDPEPLPEPVSDRQLRLPFIVPVQ